MVNFIYLILGVDEELETLLISDDDDNEDCMIIGST